jgi:predicted amidohydrolase
MRAAAIQLNSDEDARRNLAAADELTRAAAADGATLIVLPEKWSGLGGDEGAMERVAEPLDGPAITWARAAARELGVDLVAGSIAERRPGHDKLSNTSVHIGRDGEIARLYRKIHMFDVVVDGQEYIESATEEPGGEIAVSRLADGTKLGLSICYDVRFPELFRILAIRGARVIALPAAFTKYTGQAHWEVLVRARAIENQAFMVAANQCGVHPPGDKESFGGSMIVDPWGEVCARAGGAPGFIAADLNLARQDLVRAQLPSLANRVPDAYRWPAEVHA